MSKTILGSITKYPDVGDFDKIIFYIENIMLGDYNTISSRNYNRANNYFRNNNITGFNRKKYKISSHIPMIHDTLSYYHLHKITNATIDIYYKKSIDTTDLMLMRQIIDKKNRYNDLIYNSNNYRISVTLSSRFEL
jgi:hypothetical protein